MHKLIAFFQKLYDISVLGSFVSMLAVALCAVVDSLPVGPPIAVMFLCVLFGAFFAFQLDKMRRDNSVLERRVQKIHSVKWMFKTYVVKHWRLFAFIWAFSFTTFYALFLPIVTAFYERGVTLIANAGFGAVIFLATSITTVVYYLAVSAIESRGW